MAEGVSAVGAVPTSDWLVLAMTVSAVIVLVEAMRTTCPLSGDAGIVNDMAAIVVVGSKI